MLTIDVLDPRSEEMYEDFLARQPLGLLYHSLKYRTLIQRLVVATDHYFIAKRNGTVIGVLPGFLSGGPYGPVLNSLPFYGSNGGLITSDPEAARMLLNEWRRLCETASVAAATIITSPFERDTDWYELHADVTHRDSRIGQISALVPPGSPDVGGALMDRYHQKTRNMVRKAEKSGVVVQNDRSDEAFTFLFETHLMNMKSIGGLAKPAQFFAEVRKIFEQGTDFRVYTASVGEQLVAAMLCFYFNKTVEYFTPVILEEWRSHQPLSLIIHQAMQDASRLGFENWNWGGTWLSQDGVYHFKKRWGSTDQPYYYYTSLRNQDLLKATKEEIVSGYPYFYVLPFDQLTPRQTAADRGEA